MEEENTKGREDHVQVTGNSRVNHLVSDRVDYDDPTRVLLLDVKTFTVTAGDRAIHLPRSGFCSAEKLSKVHVGRSN
ncbi:hypothetical protein L596_015154 [Steinernema carpocapsae]|uniref:Uncharacterized protein n=1 Tax=Steinernema carpocapsae TaxID=34508 RepID=A0A4U5NF06_STECR|nr:hypothetical protein L596_015154 [Steinernema carpocapsae]